MNSLFKVMLRHLGRIEALTRPLQIFYLFLAIQSLLHIARQVLFK